MGEPVVTIKFTETEVVQLINTVSTYIANNSTDRYTTGHNIPELDSGYYKLKNDLKKIRKWIDEEKHKKLTDKRISKDSTEEQTEVETKHRICVPCED